MAPIDLNRLHAFAALYETGSFTAAARRLAVPRSTISRSIAALEDALGEELVFRTTRRVAITDEGKDLYDRVAPSLTALTTALADRPERADEPTGLLRVTGTPDLSALLLSEAAVRFTARYPRTEVEIVATTRFLDLARDGIDLALRIIGSKLPDSSLRMQRIGTFIWQMYAAPSYLARHGAPRTQRDLAEHAWVGFKGPLSGAAWQPPNSKIVSDDVFVARELLRKGGGVGGLPAFLAADDVQAGTLVAVLPKVTLIGARVYLVQPARKHVASRVTAFKQLLLELVRQRPLA